MAFPKADDREDRIVAPPSPVLGLVWHGDRASNAHHEEIGVIADGPASATPSENVAGAPPEGVSSK
jgi:hypothetical protein